MKRLIDLDGIARVEHGMNLKNAKWAPENDDLEERIEALSKRHFGRTFAQTYYEYADPFWDLYDESDPYDDDEDDEVSADRQFVYDQMNAAADWDLHFAVLHEPFEAQLPLWAALGWDVTDGKGRPLTCFGRFGRQMLAHAKGLPVTHVVEASVSAEDWGSKLAQEAAQFGRRR